MTAAGQGVAEMECGTKQVTLYATGIVFYERD